MSDPEARTVRLSGAAGAQAVVVASRGHLWLVTDGLAHNDTGHSTYVLWTAPAAAPDGMVGVRAFDAPDGRAAVVDAGAMPSSVAVPATFAVSLERGRAVPAHPSTPVLNPVA
jgi:hypothetical protein